MSTICRPLTNDLAFLSLLPLPTLVKLVFEVLRTNFRCKHFVPLYTNVHFREVFYDLFTDKEVLLDLILFLSENDINFIIQLLLLRA